MRLQEPDRELLWKLTNGWPPAALPADNPDDPAVRHLRANDLVEIVEGKVQATQAGYDLRALIEHQDERCQPSAAPDGSGRVPRLGNRGRPDRYSAQAAAMSAADDLRRAVRRSRWRLRSLLARLRAAWRGE